jgi:hypothetical protein
MNGPSEKHFPALKFIMRLYKGVALLIGIGAMLSTIAQYSSMSRYYYGNEGLVFLFGGILGSLLITASIYAIGEAIDLQLTVEKRLHHSNELQESMLQALNKLSDMDEKNKNMY